MREYSNTINRTGFFTMAAAATKVITDPNFTNGSIVQLIPFNAAAAVLQGSAKFLYASTGAPGASFTVATANAVAAAGTEQFNYVITN
jgi:hypothetical protein